MARVENHWHRGAGVCDDGMAASVRWRGTCGNAIVPNGPALAYPSADHSALRLISSRKVQDSYGVEERTGDDRGGLGSAEPVTGGAATPPDVAAAKVR